MLITPIIRLNYFLRYYIALIKQQNIIIRSTTHMLFQHQKTWLYQIYVKINHAFIIYSKKENIFFIDTLLITVNDQ